MVNLIEKVADLAGVSPGQLMRYILWTSIVAVMLGVGQTYITQIIGVAYPAFMSFAALKSEGMDDDKQWLTYWVCFGVLTIMDQFVGIILQFIPFYYFLKLSVLVWLMHPSSLGATWVFDNYILPKMKEAEKRLAPHL